MTTSPSDGYNMKARELWCPKCKQYTISDEVQPVCVDCFGQPLITVVYSVVDGRRVTGANELGSTGS